MNQLKNPKWFLCHSCMLSKILDKDTGVSLHDYAMSSINHWFNLKKMIELPESAFIINKPII